MQSALQRASGTFRDGARAALADVPKELPAGRIGPAAIVVAEPLEVLPVRNVDSNEKTTARRVLRGSDRGGACITRCRMEQRAAFDQKRHGHRAQTVHTVRRPRCGDHVASAVKPNPLEEAPNGGTMALADSAPL